MTANVEELGKITASKEILNDITIAYGASRDFYRRTGCNALADRCSKICGSIHDALEKSGYFND